MFSQALLVLDPAGSDYEDEDEDEGLERCGRGSRPRGRMIALAGLAGNRVQLPSAMKAVLLLALCVLASCAVVQSHPADNLVGEWRYADRIQSCHYVFNRGGSFKGEVVYRGKLISKFTGRWSVEGDTLVYTYTGDALGRIPVGAIDRDKLLVVQKNSFTIEAADGSRRKYLRIR